MMTYDMFGHLSRSYRTVLEQCGRGDGMKFEHYAIMVYFSVLDLVTILYIRVWYFSIVV